MACTLSPLILQVSPHVINWKNEVWGKVIFHKRMSVHRGRGCYDVTSCYGQHPPQQHHTPGHYHTPWTAPPLSRSTRGRYASYWNPFLFSTKSEKILQKEITITISVDIDTPCFLFDARQLCMNGGTCAAENNLPGCM